MFAGPLSFAERKFRLVGPLLNSRRKPRPAKHRNGAIERSIERVLKRQPRAQTFSLPNLPSVVDRFAEFSEDCLDGGVHERGDGERNPKELGDLTT